VKPKIILAGILSRLGRDFVPVRERGDLQHRVSYEADGPKLEAMISGGMATAWVMSGYGWARLANTA
jgi:hypothetical protein